MAPIFLPADFNYIFEYNALSVQFKAEKKSKLRTAIFLISLAIKYWLFHQ